MIIHSLVRHGVTALAIAMAVPASAASVPTLPPEALVPGQEAVVHTVFQGHRVETFTAEIVGVLRSGRAAGDMILARATSERVIRSGVAQGMSGSPVYVDGKLIGALSSGWPFSREPLFGITPIAEMLEVLDFPTDGGEGSSVGPAGVQPGRAGAPQVFRGLSWWDAPSHGISDESDEHMPQPLALPLAVGGLNGEARAYARERLDPLRLTVLPGGVAESGGTPADSVVAGSAIAVDLMWGDLQFSAIGTVTWRDADRLLLFGHPFFQSGQVHLPLSSAEITTIVGSDFNSFKLGVRGQPIGTAEQDRRAAVSGRLGAVPPMLPLRVGIRREDGSAQRFQFESIQDRTLTPTLFSIAVFNSMLESGGAAGNQTLRWTLTLHRRHGEDLVLSDVVAGEAPTAQAAGDLGGPLAFLLGNPFAPVLLDSIDVRIDVKRGREDWVLRHARIDRATVHPGEHVKVTCDVEQWWGGARRAAVDVAFPEELEPGLYELRIGGGTEMTRYEGKVHPARFRPQSLDEAWRRLANSRPSDAIYVALISSAPAVTLRGHDYPGLPLSVREVLDPPVAGRASHGGGNSWVSEQAIPWPGPLAGELVVPVKVERRTP